MPHRKSLALVWRRREQRYKMIGTRCAKCDTHFFPPRGFCPNCRRKGEVEPKEMVGTGKVFSYTTVYSPLEGFEELAPYIIAVIQLDEGPRLTAMLCDVEPEEVRVEMPVKAVFRKISEDGKSGIIHYGYKFAPVKKE
jgi:uncharacterized OB-fold protein